MIEIDTFIIFSLGFTGGTKVYGSSKFGPGTGYVVIDNVKCNGTETSILDCHLNGASNVKCYHSNDVGVSCTNQTCVYSDMITIN